MLKYLVTGVIAFAIVAGGLFFWKFNPFFDNKPKVVKPTELVVWGLWEDESFIKPALDEYKKIYPDLNIKYVYSRASNYRARAQTQIAEGQGPDVLMIHNTWLPMFLKTNLLAGAPSEIMTMDELTSDFYPVVKSDFTSNNSIYALPRGIDGLAMYYNEDILKAVGASVPKDWFEFKETAYKVNVVEENIIKTSGAALGLTGNVDHWSDLLGLLYLQQTGAKIEAPNSDAGTIPLRFFIQFANRDNKTWDQTMEPSTQAFAAGKVAFYFAPSWRAHELRHANEKLNFKIAPVPQNPGKNVAWANYWGYAVSSKSKFPKDSWEFVKFLTSEKIQMLLYENASKNENRLFGLPYSRISLQEKLKGDPLAYAFVEQGPIYKSWYLSSDTMDQAINDDIIKYYEDAVNEAVKGQDPLAALETARLGIDQVLTQYSLIAAPKPQGQ